MCDICVEVKKCHKFQSLLHLLWPTHWVDECGTVLCADVCLDLFDFCLSRTLCFLWFSKLTCQLPCFQPKSPNNVDSCLWNYFPSVGWWDGPELVSSNWTSSVQQPLSRRMWSIPFGTNVLICKEAQREALYLCLDMVLIWGNTCIPSSVQISSAVHLPAVHNSYSAQKLAFLRCVENVHSRGQQSQTSAFQLGFQRHFVQIQFCFRDRQILRGVKFKAKTTPSTKRVNDIAFHHCKRREHKWSLQVEWAVEHGSSPPQIWIWTRIQCDRLQWELPTTNAVLGQDTFLKLSKRLPSAHQIKSSGVIMSHFFVGTNGKNHADKSARPFHPWEGYLKLWHLRKVKEQNFITRLRITESLSEGLFKSREFPVLLLVSVSISRKSDIWFCGRYCSLFLQLTYQPL